MLRRIASGLRRRLLPVRPEKQFTPPTYLPSGVTASTQRIGHVAFIGSDVLGLGGGGKGRPHQFLAPLQYGLLKRHVTSSCHVSPAAFLDSDQCALAEPTIAVLIYNEETPASYPDSTAIAQIEANGIAVANSPTVGAIIGSKQRTCEVLRNAGIRVPKSAQDAQSSRLFSTVDSGSALPALTLDAGAPVDPTRHNVEFVDTRHEFAGRQYYVSLRATSFGASIIDAWPRFRPVEDGDPSVHTNDTPFEPAAIEHFQQVLVDKRRAEFVNICQRAGEALGLGTYVLDILPSTTTGELIVCEMGLKYDNYEIRDHLGFLAADLPSLQHHFSMSIADRTANSMVEECTWLQRVA